MSAKIIQEDEKPPESDNSKFSWFLTTLSDWLELMSGPYSSTNDDKPKKSVFDNIVEKQNWTRILKLLTLMVSFSGLIAGVATVNKDLNFIDVLSNLVMNPTVAVILVLTAIFSLFYKKIARIFGVSIPSQKSFFIFLSIIIPWLPFFALLNVIINYYFDYQLAGAFSVIFFYAVISIIIYNLYSGIVKISQASKLKVLFSILVPLILIVALSILIHENYSTDDPKNNNEQPENNVSFIFNPKWKGNNKTI